VNDRWDPSMIPDGALVCDDLLLCDYFVAPGLQGEAARSLLDAASGRGARTFFDTSWDPAGFGESTRRKVRDLLGCVDVFLANEAEACALASFDGDIDRHSAAVAAHVLKADTRGWVVVKLGARGCLAVGPDGTELEVPAPAVDVADTTGAGDAFNAGLVHALDGGAPWTDALEAATRFASTIVSRPSHERYRSGASR
jgi:sugar/nucleoside kinase (ribokinase family)